MLKCDVLPRLPVGVFDKAVITDEFDLCKPWDAVGYFGDDNDFDGSDFGDAGDWDDGDRGEGTEMPDFPFLAPVLRNRFVLNL